jgi:hypothetical protein
MDTGADLLGSGDRPGNGTANGTGKVRARDRGPNVDGTGSGVADVAIPETDQPGRVPVAESAADAAPSWDTKASLKLRFLRAQRDVETLIKDSEIKGTTAKGGSYSYKGISSAQVVARSKSALISHGVLYTSEIDIDSVKVNGNKTLLVVVGTFESVDSDETKIVRMWGEGTDNSDNGHAKAFTNGNKQILLKQLNLTTVEDEKTTEVEHETQPRSTAIKAAEAQTEVAVQQWADAFRAAIRGATSLQELKKIRGENAQMMKSVPEVTRDYFAELIASMEGSLS